MYRTRLQKEVDPTETDADAYELKLRRGSARTGIALGLVFLASGGSFVLFLGVGIWPIGLLIAGGVWLGKGIKAQGGANAMERRIAREKAERVLEKSTEGSGSPARFKKP